MREKRPQPGERYRHFKDKLYQVIAVAIHSETQEELVIYQALYGDFAVYARPLALFMGEVDHKKYPDVKQKYRFEKVEQKGQTEFVSESVKNKISESASARNKTSESASVHDRASESVSVYDRTSEPKTVNNRISLPETEKERGAGKKAAAEQTPPDRVKVLIDFLDCESNEEKLEYLRTMKKYIDDRMMNDISFALDIVIEEGELEDRIRTLENCLKTFCRYEGTRLR